MPRLLTSIFVERVKPGRERKEYGDTSGGRLLVHPSGAKTWVHRYRDASGKPRKDTLGPAVGAGALTVSAMREAVAKARRQLEQGVTPPRAVPVLSANSVAAYAVEFLTKHHFVNNRRSTATAAERTFNNIVLPVWGNRDVKDIRRRDVIELVEAAASERGPAMAEYLVRTLSKFFGWLLARDMVASSPCLGVASLLPRPATPRQRTLEHETELVPLLKAAATERPEHRAFHVLALTGQRLSEVSGMRWSELDSETRTWTLPAPRVKNNREHKVPLSMQVLQIVDAQPRLAGDDHVFTYGRGPVNAWNQTKKRLSTQAGVDEKSWRMHDLRRTCASGMQRLGVRVEVIERSLNHRSGAYRGIVGTYQVDPLESEVREALQRWADYVEELVSGVKSTKVVRMHKTK